jgi:ATP-dependent RNA helicase SUPV3L1/SUV3
LKLISKLLEATGDELHVHEYKRLSSLNVEHKTIREFSDFKPGDCIVAFSRKTVFQIKNAINKSFNKRTNGGEDDTNHCAVIYGALPPDTKKTQAYMFNNRLGNIKFLVATDAVGMGLNLNI